MSTVNALFHIVINTKHREMVISEAHKRDLYKYVWGICTHQKCELYRINGIANHIHMLIELHPTVSLSDFVKQLKQASSTWLRTNPNFPKFVSWGKEYFAFSVSRANADAVKQYIINQETHHGVQTFESEMQEINLKEQKEWNDILLS